MGNKIYSRSKFLDASEKYVAVNNDQILCNSVILRIFITRKKKRCQNIVQETKHNNFMPYLTDYIQVILSKIKIGSLNICL